MSFFAQTTAFIFAGMIYFFTPYSFEKKLFQAYDQYISLIGDQDWVCFLDGDTAFLRSDFGFRIKEYTERYPDTGMFVCYASRCHYQFQQVNGGKDMEDPSILRHKEICDETDAKFRLQADEVHRRVAGHLMCIKKTAWTRIRRIVQVNTINKQILGVDTQISYAMLSQKLPIRLMKGIYILHYLRMKEGFDYKEHLR